MEEPIHWRFLKVLDSYCIHLDASDLTSASTNVRFQYLYFAAKVVARSPVFDGYDPGYFYFIARELLANHKRYLEFVKRIYDMAAV